MYRHYMTKPIPSLELLDRFVIDRRREGPLHAQIEHALRQTIARDFADGDVFFKEVEIAARLGVARATTRQALGAITRDGLLRRRPGTATIVTKSSAAEQDAAKSQVGIFVADYDSEMTATLLQKIMEECRRRSLTVRTYYTHFGESVQQAYRQISLSSSVERFLVFANSELSEALTESGYQSVSIESPGRDYRGAVVETDSSQAVQIGIAYLQSLGHEKIALLVNEPSAALSVQEKMDQFRLMLPNAPVVVCGTVGGESSYQAAYAHMGELWGRDSTVRPTAIMTVSDPGAWAALRWLEEQGVSVPAEVSVLGFEDSRSSRFMRPALSSIAHPVEALAREAVALLWDEWGIGPQVRRLAPELVVRESTGPVQKV